MNMKDIRRHELIGLLIEVIDAENSALIGIKGTIIDETKNTIKILQDGKEKTLLKEQITFKTKINNKLIKINGKILVAKPEERIKK